MWQSSQLQAALELWQTAFVHSWEVDQGPTFYSVSGPCEF